MSFIKNKSAIPVIVVISLLLTCAIIAYVNYVTYESTTTGQLSEVDDGIYVQTYSVYSNIPANNTDVAVVCMNGQICKITGQIIICVTDETPSYSYTQTHIVNGDKLTVFVPKGTIQQMNSVASK